tara:strand:- start:514 stop:795 length:282 start_codon:yes stop_codon:yes gene_type:complete
MVHDNISAHLGLFHFLNFLVELESLLSVNKSFLLGRPGGFASEIVLFIGIVRAEVVVVATVMLIMMTFRGSIRRVNLGQLVRLLLDKITVLGI